MSHRTIKLRPFLLLLAGLCAGCSGDEGGSTGRGSVQFTTWGEEFIEVEIPAGAEQGGFVDGWSVRYSKFLVAFHAIRVASGSDLAFEWTGSKLFDNTLSGVKPVADTGPIPAGAWTEVGYAIAPPLDGTELAEGVLEGDAAMMRDEGYGIYVEGTAVKGELEKRFAWGFPVLTRYLSCRSEQGGRDELGLVVKNDTRVDAELTTHGDHLFYDRLKEAEGQVTNLRFDALAEADADDDGEVTIAELDEQRLDVTRYNRSGLDATTFGDYLRQLARTLGHFRGEGECSVSDF